MLTYEQRADKIAMHAWKAWTRNGNSLDDADWIETTRTVQDAVGNTYYDGISDAEWLDKTLKRLGA